MSLNDHKCQLVFFGCLLGFLCCSLRCTACFGFEVEEIHYFELDSVSCGSSLGSFICSFIIMPFYSVFLIQFLCYLTNYLYPCFLRLVELGCFHLAFALRSLSFLCLCFSLQFSSQDSVDDFPYLLHLNEFSISVHFSYLPSLFVLGL